MTKTVQIETSAGTLRVELDDERAPKSVANFIDHVTRGHYDNTVFHRVIKGFMVQGGGFEPGMKQKESGAPIANEANNGLKNKHYSLAMARTNDPHSATAQFFINVNDNAGLDQANARDGEGYAVFGRVAEGMEVVDAIRALPTLAKGPHQNLPATPVVIRKASLEK